MDVAFVENSENNIHHENRGEKKERQTAKELAKDERFALEGGLHTRNLLMHLCEAVFDEFRGITDRNVWQEVEVDGDACELVEVIDRLRTNDLLGRCDRAQRHEVGDRASSGRDRSTACSGRAEIDLEYRVRLQNGNDTGNRADRFLQLRDALFNWRALTSRFEKTKNQSLRRRGASSEAGEGEKLRDVWIILQLLVDLLLIGM